MQSSQSFTCLGAPDSEPASVPVNSEERSDALRNLSTVRDWIRYGASHFERAGLHFGHGYPDASAEASYLVLHSLCLLHSQRELWLDAQVLGNEREQLWDLIHTRSATRKPAAYLTQEAWLGPFRFYVDERAIVPRSFLAEVLDHALDPWIENFEGLERVADVCTGGGSLAVLLALKCPHATVDAVELSEEALKVAERNRDDYGLTEQIRLLHGDLFGPLTPGAYQLILSNPPYVDALAMSSLPLEYRAEPELALASGTDGLAHARRLIAESSKYLQAGGVLVVEIGHHRTELERAFPDLPFVWLDLAAGEDFVFVLRREDLPAATSVGSSRRRGRKPKS